MKRILILAVVLVATAACPKDEPLPPHQASTTATSAADTATVTPVNTATTTATQTAAPVAAPASGAAIASSEGELSDVRVDVTQLKRDSGGTVTLRFAVVNSSSDTTANNDNRWLADPSVSGEYWTVSGVHLIDPVNKKKYFVVRDTDGACVCSREIDRIGPGKKMNFWAKFPAPPPDVQRVTVVVPHFAPLDDVPLS
jgi:hypothetical protein